MIHGVEPFPDIYRTLLGRLIDSPFSEVNRRTSAEIKMLEGGVSFMLDLSGRRVPVPGCRRVYPKTAAAEIAWFLQGHKSLNWINRYAKIWQKFAEDDGTVQGAYGYRWRKHFKRDQIAQAIDALAKNPTDRRVYISAWDPASDGLGEPDQKNVPCPVGFTFSIVNNRLNSTLLIRSSDVFVGLPYDVMGHAMLMDVIASSINCCRRREEDHPTLLSPGFMTVTLAHPHLYEAHYEMTYNCLVQPIVDDKPIMQSFDIWGVEHDPESFVEAYEAEAKTLEWSTNNPRPELIL